jgi:3-deoxy-manno-octulosonate cytidylyltransferase (CMP-KDO synthetase)
MKLAWRPTIVVNVQGDGPLIPPSVIDQVAANWRPQARGHWPSDRRRGNPVNPSVVKVVSDLNGLALTFSRHRPGRGMRSP